MAQQFENFQKTLHNFYSKLKQDNTEAFAKLYSSTTSAAAELPQFPAHLESYAEEEIGAWVFKDPSKWAAQSWLVGKWKGLQPDLQKELHNIKVVDKFLPMLLVVMVAILAKLAMTDGEKLMQFLGICKLMIEFAMLVVFVKLLKVAQTLELQNWKIFGLLAKLEFGMICAG